jgi:hypothetical protein
MKTSHINHYVEILKTFFLSGGDEVEEEDSPAVALNASILRNK